jgi:hypothetical protein
MKFSSKPLDGHVSESPKVIRTKKDRKRGRPSKAEQLKIRSDLLECFDESFSVEFAHKKTGYSRTTIKNYYRKFYDEIIETKEKDFIEQSKIEIEQTALAIEGQISKLLNKENNLGKQISDSFSKNNKVLEEDIKLYKEFRNYAKEIIAATLMKTSLRNSPTADITLKKLVQELK